MGKEKKPKKPGTKSLQRIVKNRKKITKQALKLINQGHQTLISMQNLVITLDDAADGVFSNFEKLGRNLSDLSHLTEEERIIDLDEDGNMVD